jgi:integrating conjugative element protein (TIGR03758 family)
MNADMNTGFSTGSGLDPGLMHVSVQTIATGVIFLIFGWVVLQITVAYSREDITAAQAMQASLKATVVLTILIAMVFMY